jgi:coenzyme PQQ biosynthesis protein PqqD
MTRRGHESATLGCPRLPAGVRFHTDRIRGGHVLFRPEGVVRLNETAASVVACIDGTKDVDDIVSSLECRYIDVSRNDVLAVIRWLSTRGLLQTNDR